MIENKNNKIDKNYLSLALFWFFYFNVIGISIPYMSLYFKNVTFFSSTQIGIILTTFPIATLLWQPFWGIIADYTGYRVQILILACLGAAISYLLLYNAVKFFSIFVCMIVLTFFSTSIIPLANSVTFSIVNQLPFVHIGNFRVYGTFGFLCSILFYPMVSKFILNNLLFLRIRINNESDHCIQIIFFVMAMLCFICGAILTRIDRNLKFLSVRAKFIDILDILKNKTLLYRLLIITGGYVFLHGPLGLFPFLANSKGMTTEQITYIWLFMLVVEAILVKNIGIIQKYFTQHALLIIAILLGGFRWIM